MNLKQKQQILNLSSDLRRIAWWAADKENDRSHLIKKFLGLVKVGEIKNREVEKILNDINLDNWKKARENLKNKMVWAEEVLTISLRLKHLALP
ncbi:hypothetical protein HY946_00750 [Candidatus Gottesmanbacteria bacterium]|nr:hypothetical protein [Candidatus Gottesmanbacteria bacterium]